MPNVLTNVMTLGQDHHMETNATVTAELAALRAELQALVDDASYAKSIKVVRASKIVELLERTR